MADHHLHQHVEVSDDGRTVAAAEVIISGGSGGTARVSLRAESGHITPGRRASLVEIYFEEFATGSLQISIASAMRQAAAQRKCPT